MCIRDRVGEEWSYNPIIVSYWQKGGKNKDGYTSSLKSLFDFPMQSALVNGLNEKEAFNDGLIKIYQTLANDFVYPDANNLVIMTDNHDTVSYTHLYYPLPWMVMSSVLPHPKEQK